MGTESGQASPLALNFRRVLYENSKEVAGEIGCINTVNFSEGVLFTTVNKGYYVEIYSVIDMCERGII